MEKGRDEERSEQGDVEEGNIELSKLFFNRTELLLGADDLDCLHRSRVVVAGCGGVGGGVIVTLARMGIGHFVLADPGLFDEPDVNRQWAATKQTLGLNKAEVYEELVRSINPMATVEVFPEGVTPDTLDELVSRGDLVVDGLDFSLPLPLRMRFYQRTMELDRYCISSPIIGFGTMTFVAAPGGMGMDRLIQKFIAETSANEKLPAGMAKLFFPDHVEAFNRHIGTGAIPSSSIAATLSAAVQSAEIVLILLGARHPYWRAPVCLPRLTVNELLGPTARVVHYSEIFPDLDVDSTS